MAFPSTLSSFPRPNPTDRLNSPSHSGLHNTVSSALGQVEAVIGVDGASSLLGTIIGDLRSPGSAGGGHVQTAVKGGTGQTTFAKGDLLVAQSASVLAKLAVGASGSVLVPDSTQSVGIKWGSIGSSVTPASIMTFTVSSVGGWTKPSLLSYSIVEVVGGGGGGGGTNSNNAGGGGGGAGGYARRRIPASLLSASETISIGAAGGGGGGAGPNDGGTGGTTVFGATSSLVSAAGGVGGVKSTGTIALGGIGGTGLVGDFLVNGGDGGTSVGNITGIGGHGGGSYFGGGAKGQISGAGFAASVWGAGGSGAVNNTGGAGQQGVIIVTDYYV